jgi:DNA-binding NarL/FixJ family response regulator
MNAPQPITVLIADDHPIFRRGLCEVIAGDPGLNLVAEAGDGDQALDLIQARHPAVAVLDIHMPKRSGVRVARDLRDLRWPGALIFLTMDNEEGLLNEALNLGVLGYLLKENAVAELLAAIHSVAAGKSYVCQALSPSLLRRRAAAEVLRAQAPGLDRLTPAERQVLKLIAEDRTSKEIARFLGCSVRTIETHRLNISRKLELSGTHSLLRFAFNHKSEL